MTRDVSWRQQKAYLLFQFNPFICVFWFRNWDGPYSVQSYYWKLLVVYWSQEFHRCVFLCFSVSQLPRSRTCLPVPSWVCLSKAFFPMPSIGWLGSRKFFQSAFVIDFFFVLQLWLIIFPSILCWVGSYDLWEFKIYLSKPFWLLKFSLEIESYSDGPAFLSDLVLFHWSLQYAMGLLCFVYLVF